MRFQSLFLYLCFALQVLAEEVAKTTSTAAKPDSRAEWTWPSPSVETMARYSKLSAEAKSKLQAEFSGNSEKLKTLSVAEYNARFDKAFRAAVKEDEEKGLSTGGAPTDLFRVRTLTSSASNPSSRSGPSPEVRERWEKLSDTAKDKIRKLFQDNRERLSSMTEEERRKFMESNFNTIAQEDEAARKTK